MVRWYYGDNRRLAEVEAIVIENNVTEFVLSKAKVVEKSVSFDAGLKARHGSRIPGSSPGQASPG